MIYFVVLGVIGLVDLTAVGIGTGLYLTKED